MSDAKNPTTVALDAASVGIAVATGAITPLEGAKQLARLSVDLIPVGYLREYLTDRDRVWADLAADIAEEIKLDGGKP